MRLYDHLICNIPLFYCYTIIIFAVRTGTPSDRRRHVRQFLRHHPLLFILDRLKEAVSTNFVMVVVI